MRHSKNQLQSAPWAANPRMIHLRFVNCDCVKDWTARKVLNAKTIGVPFNTLLRYLKSDNLFNGDDGSESEREKETERKKLRARSFSSFFLSSVPIPPTRDSSGCVSSSVTRLDDYRKFLATNSPLKVAQKDCWLLEYFEKDQLIKNCYGYYLGNFWKHLGNFFNPLSGHTGLFPKSKKWSNLETPFLYYSDRLISLSGWNEFEMIQTIQKWKTNFAFQIEKINENQNGQRVKMRSCLWEHICFTEWDQLITWA